MALRLAICCQMRRSQTFDLDRNSPDRQSELRRLGRDQGRDIGPARRDAEGTYSISDINQRLPQLLAERSMRASDRTIFHPIDTRASRPSIEDASVKPELEMVALRELRDISNTGDTLL